MKDAKGDSGKILILGICLAGRMEKYSVGEIITEGEKGRQGLFE